jgi:hypothetical protein
MSKVITSPVGRFPGTVTLSDPLTFPQSLAVEDALEAANALGEGASMRRQNYTILPGLLACIEEWNVTGKGMPESPTPDTFPSTPAIAAAELIAWLIEEIISLYHETEPDPNE